jgi:hypothetical protein
MNAFMQHDETRSRGRLRIGDDRAGLSPDQSSGEHSPAIRSEKSSLQEFIARAETSGHFFHFT